MTPLIVSPSVNPIALMNSSDVALLRIRWNPHVNTSQLTQVLFVLFDKIKVECSSFVWGMSHPAHTDERESLFGTHKRVELWCHHPVNMSG
jgi:hypothetical protein